MAYEHAKARACGKESGKMSDGMTLLGIAAIMSFLSLGALAVYLTCRMCDDYFDRDDYEETEADKIANAIDRNTIYNIMFH